MNRSRVALCAVLALCVVLALAAGCVAPRAPRHPSIAERTPPGAIVAALARRERATRGLRLSMTVRLTGTEQSSVLSSPAYLAIDDAGAIRLQVLSPFGMTVLDLAIHGDRYTLTLPMRHQTSEGTLDLRTLDDPTVAVSDRMIVALALLFRPKAGAGACTGAAPATIACTVGPTLAAHVVVDDHLRPLREDYVRADGKRLLVATYDDYLDDDPTASPRSLVIEDPGSGARMAIRVIRARVATASHS